MQSASIHLQSTRIAPATHNGGGHLPRHPGNLCVVAVDYSRFGQQRIWWEGQCGPGHVHECTWLVVDQVRLSHLVFCQSAAIVAAGVRSK